MSLDNKLMADSRKKIQVEYSKIVANRGKRDRKSLFKLYSFFCDRAVLFPVGVFSLL